MKHSVGVFGDVGEVLLKSFRTEDANPVADVFHAGYVIRIFVRGHSGVLSMNDCARQPKQRSCTTETPQFWAEIHLKVLIRMQAEDNILCGRHHGHVHVVLSRRVIQGW